MPFVHVREITVEQAGELRLGGLPLQAGERVQVFVIRKPPATAEHYPLRGQLLHYDDPFEPAIPPEEWEATK